MCYSIEILQVMMALYLQITSVHSPVDKDLLLHNQFVNNAMCPVLLQFINYWN